MSSTYGDCSKPKKSKTSGEITFTSHWAYLPSLLLHEIFNLLNKKDRRNASAVCKHWRQNSFHPKWWPRMSFKLEDNDEEKSRFFIYTFGHIVAEVKISINSLSSKSVEDFIHLLHQMTRNNHLKSIIIEPSHCRLELPTHQIGSICDGGLGEIVNLLKTCLEKRINRFSIGCIEDLCLYIEDILENINASSVTHLGLASVKDDPDKYQANYFDPILIAPFTKLQVLSIDYDQLSDEFLSKLNSAKELKRLIVHLHSVRKNHPGTTNQAWIDFSNEHPRCEFRLTVIHAFEDIGTLHETVMRQHMPLSHLKVFFCEQVNLHIIENLSNYADTLRSVLWVDSLSNSDNSWILVKPWFDESPDPFVLTAWLCKHLEEFVLFGYKYWEENLVAIGRLRGGNLKRLEIAEPDIIYPPGPHVENALVDIPNSMDRPWEPKKRSELHPVICSPTDGDSDEYLLPLVLADLH